MKKEWFLKKVNYQYLATTKEWKDLGNVLKRLLASQMKSEYDQDSAFVWRKELRKVLIMT